MTAADAHPAASAASRCAQAPNAAATASGAFRTAGPVVLCAETTGTAASLLVLWCLCYEAMGVL